MTANLPVPVNLGGPITDLDQAMRAADIMSRSDLLPYALRGNAPNTLLVMLTGQELGLTLTQAFRTIYVPSGGQPQLRGVLVLSRLRLAGHTYRFEETDTSCTFTVVRGDTKEEYTATFSIEDALTAKLAKRNADGVIVALSEKGKELPWMLYQRDLLMWRAVARGALRGAPEVMLGFEIAGTLPPEPHEEVQLRPQSPAPPEPAGEAAPGAQAAQVTQLAELDQRMREAERPVDPSTDEPSFEQESPDMGGNSADEPIAAVLAREADEAEAVAEAQEAAAVAGPEPETAASRAKTVVLAEHFTALGADPKDYRPYVLHACSCFAGRRIAGVRSLKAAEVLQLTNALSLIRRSFEEPGYPAALADQVETWRARWAETDPQGYRAYEAPGDV